MKLQFKHQKFQADAAKAVVDVFAGQPYLTPTYMMDRGTGIFQIGMNEEDDFTGWRNQPLVPELSKRMILEQIQEIQRIYQITPSQKLEGEGYNLTIEMETGVGKTYTYIKTMFELNKHYGWSKFIVVVPSIAIREGVYKSFEVTQEHFAEEYGKKIRFFIYNSAQLTEIDRFASDNSINVMIINSQAFNARGKDARRIYMKLDEFRSRRPIDIIAKTNPVLIIDEPQSVEGKQTKERLREFHPLLTLRYSATHKSDSIYNMIYRLDAMEAYNKRLVKKIAVKGIAESGSTATESYVYLQSINLSKADPTATIQFDYKGTSGIRKVTKTVSIGFNLYDQSNGMEEYHNNFVVKSIDGRDDSVEFLNGIKIYAGDVIGKVSEEQLRRIQIRETILSHIERERQLYYKGIKVLSLFFIDEVAHYKQYDETGESKNGIFADMFEEEYRDIVENLQMGIGEEAYFHYLNSISAESTHAGYFSIDKKGKMVNSKVGRSLMYQRNNKNYEMLINICYFVLDGMLQTTDKGNYKMMTFSDEHMHRLYEKFVLEYFKRHHSYLSEVRAAQVKWNLATDTEESMIRFLPAMQTDIFLRYKEKVLIIDTKYYGNSMQKQYDKVTIHSGNMYQIFTYVKNQDVENNGRVSGMLLYAKTEEAITPDCSFVIGGNKISVKTVDLNKEFKLIAAQLDKIAEDYFGKKRIEDSII